jgi:hypothetical protein
MRERERERERQREREREREIGRLYDRNIRNHKCGLGKKAGWMSLK